MTENKRFTLIKDTGTDECYCENLYDDGTYIGAIMGGSEMICYLLNSLSEENEELKSENNMLKVTIDRNEAYIKRLTETSEWHC